VKRLRDELTPVKSDPFDPLCALLGLPMSSAETEMRDELNAIQARLVALPAPPAPAPDPMAARMDALLRARHDTPWKNEGAPPPWRYLPSAKGEVVAPEGFSIVLAERHDSEVVAVAYGVLLGESEYWLLRSPDGGHSWAQPVCLCLPDPQHTRVSDDFVIPILTDGLIRLKVMRSPWVDPFVLSAPLASLTLDSDHDGLTDLLEERLALDPLNPDTDGDGLPDGRDPLPQIPSTGPLSPLTEIAVELSRQGVWAEPVGPGRPGKARDLALLIGDRALFGGASAGMPRMVVLTPSEAELYRQNAGQVAVRIDDYVPSVDGRRAYVRWNAHFSAGSFVAERQGDRWVISWVSFGVS
jgi:hypothetical protein